MKKKSASRSAFFNPRVLFGLFIGLVGVSLALLATANPLKPNVTSSQQNYKITTRSQYTSLLVPPGFDCSKIHELGINKMENLRAGAIMIFCGEAKGGAPEEGGSSSAFSKLVKSIAAQLVYGTTDVDPGWGSTTTATSLLRPVLSWVRAVACSDRLITAIRGQNRITD